MKSQISTFSEEKPMANNWCHIATFHLLIAYFGNFVFGFCHLDRLCDFLYDLFLFARQDRQDEMKNKQTITYYLGNSQKQSKTKLPKEDEMLLNLEFVS